MEPNRQPHDGDPACCTRMAPRAPEPPAAGRRRAGSVLHHGGTAAPTAPRATPTGRTRATGPGTAGQLPGPTHQLPPHRTPTHRPTPHPGRPSARPSQDRGGRAWRHGRRCIPRPALAGTGCIARPSRRRTLHFLSVPVNWDRRCGWFSHYRLSQFEGGARAQARGPKPSTDHRRLVQSVGIEDSQICLSACWQSSPSKNAVEGSTRPVEAVLVVSS